MYGCILRSMSVVLFGVIVVFMIAITLFYRFFNYNNSWKSAWEDFKTDLLEKGTDARSCAYQVSVCLIVAIVCTTISLTKRHALFEMNDFAELIVVREERGDYEYSAEKKVTIEGVEYSYPSKKAKKYSKDVNNFMYWRNRYYSKD